jgi:CBS domain containing-hemolysin-like protein
LQDQNCEKGALLQNALPVCRGRNVAYVREDVKLDVVFKEFMSSANHMLLVRREPAMPGGPDGDVTGLITLEDVMEELIGVSEISELSRRVIS